MSILSAIQSLMTNSEKNSDLGQNEHCANQNEGHVSQCASISAIRRDDSSIPEKKKTVRKPPTKRRNWTRRCLTRKRRKITHLKI